MSVNLFKNGTLTKLAGKFLIDLQMSSTSTNAVANSVVKAYIDSKGDGVLYYASETAMDADWANIPEGATISTPDSSEELTASSVSYDDGTSAGSNVQTEISRIKSALTALFTDSTTLFDNTIQGGSNITLSDNINNYRAFALIDGNTDNEASQSINVKFGSASSYPAIIASIVDYNNTAGQMVMADIALTSSDGIHYHCERSAQWNFDGNGIAYFSTNQSTSIKIVGYR